MWWFTFDWDYGCNALIGAVSKYNSILLNNFWNLLGNHHWTLGEYGWPRGENCKPENNPGV